MSGLEYSHSRQQSYFSTSKIHTKTGEKDIVQHYRGKGDPDFLSCFPDASSSSFSTSCHSGINSQFLFPTFTMTSGSSGAQTSMFGHSQTYGSNSLSCSEATTEIETPPETPGCESKFLNSSLGDEKRIGASSSGYIGPAAYVNHTEAQFDSRHLLNGYNSNSSRFAGVSQHIRDGDSAEGYDSEVEMVNKLANVGRGRSFAKLEDSDRRSSSLSFSRRREDQHTPSSPSTPKLGQHEQPEVNPLEELSPRTPFGTLKRTVKPPRLDLSTIFCHFPTSQETPQYPSPISQCKPEHNESKWNHEAELHPYLDTGMHHSAPPVQGSQWRLKGLPSPYLPPVPVTAPLMNIPKAPRIVPSIPSMVDSPSPLALEVSSPTMDGSPNLGRRCLLEKLFPDVVHTSIKGGDVVGEGEDCRRGRVLPKAKPFGALGVVGNSEHGKRGGRPLHQVRPMNVSLGQQIANLQKSAATSPIPPSLLTPEKIPVLMHQSPLFIMPVPPTPNSSSSGVDLSGANPLTDGVSGGSNDPNASSPSSLPHPIKPKRTRSASLGSAVPPRSPIYSKASRQLNTLDALGIIEPISPKRILFSSTTHKGKPSAAEERSSLVETIGTPRQRYMNPYLKAGNGLKDHEECQVETKVDCYFA